MSGNAGETDVDKWLEQCYNAAMEKASGKETAATSVPESSQKNVAEVVSRSESGKAALAVTLTCLTYKIFHPEQDIRKHQASIKDGFSGRTFDTNHITPFLRRHNFPCMAESGWLTRSFEQKSAYTLDYKGAIRPNSLKISFLYLIDTIEKNDKRQNENLLDLFLQSIIIERDKKTIAPAIPRNLLIEDIVNLLNKHFHHKYNAVGAARLPVLAIYAVYECLIAEGQKRFLDKKLQPLESHNSADLQSGRIGDIDITNEDGSSFEAVEVKFDIAVGRDIIDRGKEKILRSSAKRYYILSTAHPREEEKGAIQDIIHQVSKTHGCQLVVNGVIPTLKYYLRLLDDTSQFIERYANLVFTDSAVKFEHRLEWNNMVSAL